MGAETPWWVNPKNLIHNLQQEVWGDSAVYVKVLDKEMHYAITQWREGTAYLVGHYCNGKSLNTFDLVCDRASKRFRIKNGY